MTEGFDDRPGAGDPDPWPDRPPNEPPPDRPLRAPREGWPRFWIPFTVIFAAALFVLIRFILGTGEAWAECQLRYIEAENAADSAAVDTLRFGGDDARSCEAIRFERS